LRALGQFFHEPQAALLSALALSQTI